ncbi:MAG: hypothetical protein JNK82_28135 [Myxococcaceae bacterium]|nr:hypothetical protein [Myxococcaceae bacterium]
MRRLFFMKRHWSAFIALLTLVASPAFAQYVANITPGATFPALSNGIAIALQAPAQASPNDRGRADVQLGFTFPYYNKTYTSVTVTANGMLFLEPSTAPNVTSDFGFNFALPNVAEPRAVIAPFWDDLNGKNPTSVIQRQAVTGPDGNGLAIEWLHWSEAFGAYDLNFQVRLWENGNIDFHYGEMSGNGGTPTASCGISNPTGSQATQCKPCVQGDGGVNPAACGVADFPADTRIRFQPPPGRDIAITRLQVDSVVPSGANLQITTSLFVRNFGDLATGAFSYRLYLSADTIYDSGGVDPELTPTPRAMASIAPFGNATSTVTGTVPRPSAGTYYVLVRVDSENAVAETNELNNTAVNGVPLQNGVDLVAQDIVGPPIGGPGDMVTNTVTFSNQGLDPAGMVRFQILLSFDTNYEPGIDRVVYDGTMNVAGGQNINVPITYPLSGLVQAADYYFILVVDPPPPDGGLTAEINETNNVKVGTARFTAMQADLIIEQVRVQRTDPPYFPASVTFFGETVRLEAVVKNQGGASAPNVTVAFYLSDNETLNGVTDPFIVQRTGLSVPAGQSVLVTIPTTTVPSQAADMTPLIPGPYFFFAAAVGVMLNETTTTNNFLKSEPTLVRGPAPDLLPTYVAGPQRIGAGELMRVSRTFANFGNRDATGAKYRYYLSANTIVTTDDVPLKIMTTTGLVDEGTLSLTAGATAIATETVEVPSTAQAASYYIGVLIDPGNLIDEVTHANNGLSGQRVEVVPPGLRIDTTVLPDALLGREYAAQLHAAGGEGNYQWAMQPGAVPPPGLSLSAAGVISGSPTRDGAYSLALRLTSGMRVTDGVLVLRVVTPTSSVFIRTVDLPAPGREVDYLALMTAGGGRAPYTWVVDQGTLPQGIGLALDGTLSGRAVQSAGTAFDFVVRVRDAVGNTDTKPYRLVIVDGQSLIIKTYDLPPATVGTQYTTDIQAGSTVMASPLAVPLTWSLVYGILPTGLTLQQQDEKLFITGTPQVAGIFPFTLEVVDARNRNDTIELVLEVRAPAIALKVEPAIPDQLLRGTSIDSQFSIVGPGPTTGVRWVVRDGVLPPGLTLDESGRLTGSVDAEAELAAYSFSVAPTADGQVITFASYSTNVVERLTGRRGCGCSGAEGGLAFVALAALFLRRRSRR